MNYNKELKDILNNYQTEKICKYRGEIYHVRDNGSAYRCRKSNTKKRPLDEIWTFGRTNKQSGYLHLSSAIVHRIVATAFHGIQPSYKHIVDHIDTNRQNNRPDNLRWITKLENILLNPITLIRVIYRYGSIENFLNNPSKPIIGDLEPNFDWMRTVTKEESENTKINLLNWANEGKIPRGEVLGEWIFSTLKEKNEMQIEHSIIIQSKTPNAVQKNWKTPSEFPNCPNLVEDNALNAYKRRLAKGSTFSKNQYGVSIVEDTGINIEYKQLIVLTRSNSIKPFALAKVYTEDNKFVHCNIRSFFTKKGVQKEFNLSLGIEWEGEKSIDDYL